MRTLLTANDIKNIIKTIFNGNLDVSQGTSGAIPYENPNSEKILIINGENGTSNEKDLAEWLNIRFYSWKNRLIEKTNALYQNGDSLVAFDAWVQSLNQSMNEAYALVEVIDSEITASQDIDAGSKTARITFLVQTNKIKNLDYYVSKLQNLYAGVPQTIQNSYGQNISAYVLIGSLIYDEEPTDMQLGETIVVTCNVVINYLTEALGYTDNKIEISLEGDDTYTNGQIPNPTKYMELPLTKASLKNIFSSNALPYADRPDMTGSVATALSTSRTMTFYDFKNNTLTNAIDELFWSMPAINIDGVAQTTKNVNVPVYVRVRTNGHFYIYKDVIEEIDKVITNSEFNVTILTLKGWGKRA